MIKIDSEFSEKWGLTIEERELSLEERKKITTNKHPLISPDLMSTNLLNSNNIPTRAITITYHNKTIKSYE
jgi:hypothetical protein